MKNILFFDTDEQLSNFAQKNPIEGANMVFFDKGLNGTSVQALEPYLDTEIISGFIHSETLSTQKLDLFPNLKLIATRSTGFNHIDLEYCKKRGIAVENVPSYGATTVAEFGFALLLSLARKLITAKNDMAHNRIEISNYMGFDLLGKTIGIIGTGSIGRHMIQIAQGFGMKVIAYDPFRNPALQDLYVDTLDEIYQNSDVISLHVPSTPENFHMINEAAFNQMKKGVIIINTARGDLIDTQALYFALRKGIVAGAGLDVLENEDFLLHDEVATSPRMSDNDFLLDSAMNLKLLQFKDVIATPHIAFNSIDAINRINATTFNNIISFMKNEIVNNVIK